MRVRIRVTKVCTTCLLYAALPRWSERGRAASAASSAARAMVAASRRCPRAIGGVAGVDGGAADPRQRDPRRARPRRGVLDRDRHPGGGEVADPALELEVAARAGAGRRGDDHLDRHLVVRENGLERPGHELSRGDRPVPARALDLHAAAEGHHHGRPVALRVGVAQRTDQRAADAHDRVGDQRRRGGHRGLAAGQDRGPLESGVAAQRPMWREPSGSTRWWSRPGGR